MPSRRQERVAKRVMQELVDAIRDLKNVDIGFITITRCEISPDLRHAKVFVSVWGDKERCERSLSMLRHNASRLKGAIGRPLGTKVVPSLHFEFDETVANADQMSRLIRDARQTDANPEPLTPAEIEALRAAQADTRVADRDQSDPFEAARMEVEEELWGENGEDADDDAGDDPEWKPINLDEIPADEDED